jgi:uncharacterized protein GlcG (DUF336 family)
VKTVASLQTLALEMALSLVAGCLERARSQGWAIAVCVSDHAGAPLASARMDGVAPPVLEFAADKAFTAANMRKSTQAFSARMESSASLSLGLGGRSRLTTWSGGLPIIAEGAVIGAVGVSGARDMDDVDCAQWALRRHHLDWDHEALKG